jgi:hypothetical protein
MKSRISSYIDDCNELNDHIESLKSTSIGTSNLNADVAEYRDNSKWNYKRKELSKAKSAPNIYQCSKSVCDSARKDPFKYLCKYFNIPATEESLNNVEEVLNNFSAADDGKKLLAIEHDEIINSISNDVPFIIKKFGKKRLSKKLGFKEIGLNDAYYPKYLFRYVSAGGNASTECEIVMNVDTLDKFVNYLSDRIKFKKSAAGQRALMTRSLRNHILERDNHTCQQCGVSLEEEPHLLLEVDHIVPVSKGGLTTEDNLQTLCWRCNRTKGAKLQ